MHLHFNQKKVTCHKVELGTNCTTVNVALGIHLFRILESCIVSICLFCVSSSHNASILSRIWYTLLNSLNNALISVGSFTNLFIYTYLLVLCYWTSYFVEHFIFIFITIKIIISIYSSDVCFIYLSSPFICHMYMLTFTE